MDKFRDFLKKNWLVVVVCVIAVLFSVVGILLLINWASLLSRQHLKQ